jgi:hypothetical protein
VDKNGGQYSNFEDRVYINVPYGSVQQSIKITVETAEDFVQDESLQFLSCYECRPDKLADNIIH